MKQESFLNIENIRRSSDGVEYHPLVPFLPENAKVLFLGSFPPQRKRWCMDFYYPNFINDHWRIEGEVFFGDRNHFVDDAHKCFSLSDIVDFCRQQGIAFYDASTAVCRLEDNASDKFLDVVQPTDVRALVAQLPHLRVIVTTGEKATETLCQTLDVPTVPKVNGSVVLPSLQSRDAGRLVLYRLPSSSRAYPLAFSKKVEAYRSMFLGAGLLKTAEPQLFYYDMGKGVTAFSTTRQGGCSTGSYAAFNINRYSGDSELHVGRNRELLCRLLNIGDDHLLMPHQTHDVRVACIDEAFMTLRAAERQEALEGVDALTTRLPGVCIGVSTADCVPLLLYDPRRQAVCAVHAGWRGTVGRIAEKAVAAMVASYGSCPQDLVAQTGPGISLDSFEVGQEVYDAFAAAAFPMEHISRQYPTTANAQEQKWHIDLPQCNRDQLLAAGLRAENISLSTVCTYQQSDTYFSARRLGVRSGRIFTGIVINRQQEGGQPCIG